MKKNILKKNLNGLMDQKYRYLEQFHFIVLGQIEWYEQLLNAEKYQSFIDQAIIYIKNTNFNNQEDRLIQGYAKRYLLNNQGRNLKSPPEFFFSEKTEQNQINNIKIE
ncbi:hypothetical protein TTHERM_00827220 (macronuclear) [Tetrahymena thermophila SB210]|uniref:Uncharacterized protein n=1 Tax=Tetrahymena thermophila (strain SB210) TaxID=312017 RepID=Q22EE7_TETTS|nr:hypothetical protein TTHERM_00827220 [Tetrahymena thermophila SB210]EAR83705.1 hypothetical protein TTHERM_00827220 [Tetrahymena thermophila SB210]|eukprot:XP_001031368.1 hypothetical protein TTHERM_00827220 [Tetrahymena thermophila SB210]